MRTRPHAGPAGAMLLTLLAAALSGCQDRSDGYDREAVSGSVTLDGRPIAGDITFIPKANGPSAGGRITDGSYSLGRSNGPAPGSTASRSSPSSRPDGRSPTATGRRAARPRRGRTSSPGAIMWTPGSRPR